MPSKFEPIFIRLRKILQNYSKRLTVTEDSPNRYCLSLATHSHPRLKGPMPVAWVQIGKAYVSYHLMAVYGYPQLLDACSKELRSRMQGKSCFNFKNIDESLFTELADLTERGFTAFKKAGFGSQAGTSLKR